MNFLFLLNFILIQSLLGFSIYRKILNEGIFILKENNADVEFSLPLRKSRSEIQLLAKKYGIKANLKSEEIVFQLQQQQNLNVSVFEKTKTEKFEKEIDEINILTKIENNILNNESKNDKFTKIEPILSIQGIDFNDLLDLRTSIFSSNEKLKIKTDEEYKISSLKNKLKSKAKKSEKILKKLQENNINSNNNNNHKLNLNNIEHFNENTAIIIDDDYIQDDFFFENNNLDFVKNIKNDNSNNTVIDNAQNIFNLNSNLILKNDYDNNIGKNNQQYSTDIKNVKNNSRKFEMIEIDEKLLIRRKKNNNSLNIDIESVNNNNYNDNNNVIIRDHSNNNENNTQQNNQIILKTITTTKTLKKNNKKINITNITLEKMLTNILEKKNFDYLYQETNLRFFKTDPSLKSSLKALRKQDMEWARKKIEFLYIINNK
jgi:hypothetical protein